LTNRLDYQERSTGKLRLAKRELSDKPLRIQAVNKNVIIYETTNLNENVSQRLPISFDNDDVGERSYRCFHRIILYFIVYQRDKVRTKK